VALKIELRPTKDMDERISALRGEIHNLAHVEISCARLLYAGLIIVAGALLFAALSGKAKVDVH
jgi:hypothetical protein